MKQLEILRWFARWGGWRATAWLMLTASVRAGDATAVDIGNPARPGGTTVAAGGGGFLMTAGGADIGGVADECHFYYRTVTGDFDVRVRVESLSGGDLWAKAGLMVRESLERGSVALTAATTPSLLGSLAVSRTASGTAAVTRGGSLAGAGWLRLKRAQDSFSAYAGVDGRAWVPLGALTLATPAPLYLGLAASSHATNTPLQVVFTDWGDVAQPRDVTLPSRAELPGPSSRKSGLAITEIMYRPLGRTDGKELEFVELFNSNPFFEDISGYRLAGDIDFTFPEGTVLPGGGLTVVAKVPADLASNYGLSSVLGPYSKNLKPGGVLRLENKVGTVLLEVPYGNDAPWPLGADGTGHSLVLARPSLGEGNPAAWDTSFARGGSPGRVDPPRASLWHALSFNEYAGGPSAFVELFNTSARPLDLAGAFLSDDPALDKFQIPTGTVVPARGCVAFTASQLGFALPSAGAALYLVGPDHTQTLLATRFGPPPAGGSVGAYPDGSEEDYPLMAPTPGQPNREPQASPVVINEIMYHPISEDDDDQYLELFNPGSQAVDLSGWKFESGIDYTFPTGTSLPAGGYLVIARNLSRLRANYPNLTGANSLGDFKGRLAHGGERIVLARPVDVVDPLTGTKRTAYAAVEEAQYAGGGRGCPWAAGGGSSLELIDARADRRQTANWADSDETRKAPWTTVEAKGMLDNGYGAVDSLHVLLLGAGECLVDNVSVSLDGNPTNFISNPDFEKGLAGWSVLGDHIRSSLEPQEGDQSAQCLHVRASNNGDTGANRIRAQLVRGSSLNEGKVATLRARVRWLRGHPELLLRLKGNYLEACGRLEVPRALGTPGAANSRALPNTGPAIAQVTHEPPLPAAEQAVWVSARVSDPDGVGAVTLRYRVDPSGESLTVPMRDDGTDGDLFAGDGLYSATIPGQAGGRLVAFTVEAQDAAATRAASVFPPEAPRRECLVRFGEPQTVSAFGAYRMWMTAATVSNWVNRPVLSNEELDMTFVYGNQRVIYNASGRFSGSPWHQGAYGSPVGSACTYAVSMPGDDRLLGTTSFNKIHAPGNTPGDDGTIQCEQVAYWMVRQLGLPWNYQRYVLVYVNGQKRGSLMEDTQVPGSEVVEAVFPKDPGGNLYKVGGWYEFDDGRSGTLGFNLASWASLNKFTTTDGAPKVARYRWNWAPRAAKGTANEFASVIALSQAADNSNTDALKQGMDSQADMDQWLRTFAIEHAVGNWDSFGNRNAQNMYAYKPPQGKWKLLIWDFNIVLGNSGSDGPTGDDLFQFNYADRGMLRVYSHPAYQRAYLRHIQEIAEGPAMNSARVSELVDARYAAFRNAGVSVSSPSKIKNYVTSRRKYLTTYLTNFAVPFGLAEVSNEVNTAQNWVTLSGTAPLAVQTIRINGIEYPLAWDNALRWIVKVPLTARDNTLVVRGYDRLGQPVTNAEATVVAHFTGEVESPVGRVVINEIMYHPLVPNAEFVELRNTSSQSLFDLSRGRLEGIDYTFPDGATIEPGAYLVLARDRAAFASAYGGGVSVADVFAGRLDNQGETLRLTLPGASPAAATVLDEVTYGAQYPWPRAANGEGGSLQLIDVAKDRRDPANWLAIGAAAAARPEWRRLSVTGVAISANTKVLLYHSPYREPRAFLDVAGTWSGTIEFPGLSYHMSVVFRRQGDGWAADFLGDDLTTALANVKVQTNAISFALPSSYGDARWRGTLSADGQTIQGTLTQAGQGGATSATPFKIVYQKDPSRIDGGEVWIDDVQLVAGALPATGVNLVRDGDFESPLAAAWQIASNHAQTAVASAAAHTGQNALRLVASLGGKDEHSAVWQSVDSLTPGQTYTLSCWYLPSTNGVDLTLRLADESLAVTEAIAPPVSATPGRENSRPTVVPVTPRLLINEWMADNQHAVADPADSAYKDWFELYNPQAQAVDLTGWSLANEYTNAAAFVVPAGYSVPPGGYLLVWADGQTALNSASRADLHVSFRLGRKGETIALFAPDGSLVDAVTFGAQATDVSQARDARGQFVNTATPTPGRENQLPPDSGEEHFAITSVSVSAPGDVTLHWTSSPGRKYQVQSRDALGEGSWTNRGDPVAAGAGTSAEFVDTAARTAGVRFYRVVRLP